MPVLCGKKSSGEILSDKECRKLLSMPIESYTESDHKAPHWLKNSGKPHELDRLVSTEELLTEQRAKLSPAQAEEVEKMKLRTATRQNDLTRKLSELEAQVKAADAERESITGDRLRLLALEKKANLLRREYMKKQESQFFDAMRLDMELEQQIQEFMDQEKLTAKVTREFTLVIHN